MASTNVKAGHLVDLLSDSEENQPVEKDDLLSLLKESMNAHSTLIIEHAKLTKAYRAIAKVDAGPDPKIQ